jgi:hypothetical protein
MIEKSHINLAYSTRDSIPLKVESTLSRIKQYVSNNVELRLLLILLTSADPGPRYQRCLLSEDTQSNRQVYQRAWISSNEYARRIWSLRRTSPEPNKTQRAGYNTYPHVPYCVQRPHLVRMDCTSLATCNAL